MNDTLVTLLLLAIGGGALWLGFWVVNLGRGDDRGGNANADPSALSANSVDAILKRRR
ncbi:MAG: hypothetical protein JNJ55_08425 [Betaproteobacteria bacterium]|nr:hypothetical protein [Betaproteobacteria bacterium]